MTTPPAVRLTGLTKRFGAVAAVDDVSLEISRGEVVALLGPNGAGKSTTIDLALGLSRPSAGSPELFGGLPRAAIVDGRVGAMLQGGALLPTLTVAQSVALVAAAHRHPLAVAEALRRAGATGIADRRVARLSGGEAQRARFAVAIVSDPELLVLDEPTAAMDVEARRGFWTSMRALTEAGRTVVFATHYLEEAESFADRIVILRGGRIVADGTPAEIKASASGRTLSVTLDRIDETVLRSVRGLPGTTGVSHRGSRLHVITQDSDAAVRAVLGSWPDARDLEVVSRTLDDAFVALTSGGIADTPSSTARPDRTEALR